MGKAPGDPEENSVRFKSGLAASKCLDGKEQRGGRGRSPIFREGACFLLRPYPRNTFLAASGCRLTSMHRWERSREDWTLGVRALARSCSSWKGPRHGEPGTGDRVEGWV